MQGRRDIMRLVRNYDTKGNATNRNQDPQKSPFVIKGLNVNAISSTKQHAVAVELGLERLRKWETENATCKAN